MSAAPDRRWALVAGPLLALLAGIAAHGGAGLPTPAAWTVAITTLCAFWWVTEPVPVPITSLLPFALLPLTGVLDHKAVAGAYGHTLILLLMGGFMLSVAVERAGAHRRMAVGLVRLVGKRGPRGLVLGFMLATAASSMWISNTATTLMMLPVAAAVLEQATARGEREQLRLPLMLGIAYAASIGGLGTPVGTPPNVVFMGVYKEVTGTGIGFAEWMAKGLPVVAALLPLAWLWLVRRLPRRGTAFALPEPGPWTSRERRVLVVGGLTAFAWVTRTEPFGGWTGLVDAPGVGDSTIALAAVVVLALMPSGERPADAPAPRLLAWADARRIPWGLLLLFGGGIAIARAFQASGLADATGRFLADDLGIATWPALAMVGGIALAVTFLTEVTSNTATTTLLMPVLAAAGVAAGVDPAVLMIPATLSASCAFMLPVATAPNAIVFGSGEVSTREMAREGFVLNLLGALVITALTMVS
jgi:solute carrier family 13 (sodium-dependent dicarboxylate transporter), member 2/3/5